MTHSCSINFNVFKRVEVSEIIKIITKTLSKLKFIIIVIMSVHEVIKVPAGL